MPYLHQLILLVSSTYGSNAYNTGTYNGAKAAASVQIGPLTLPGTGASWLAIIGSLMIATAAGCAVWVWQRRRQRATATPN